MIDTKYTEVLPCRCDAEECDYKQQWVDAGSPFRIPEKYAGLRKWSQDEQLKHRHSIFSKVLDYNILYQERNELLIK